MLFYSPTPATCRPYIFHQPSRPFGTWYRVSRLYRRVAKSGGHWKLTEKCWLRVVDKKEGEDNLIKTFTNILPTLGLIAFWCSNYFHFPNGKAILGRKWNWGVKCDTKFRLQYNYYNFCYLFCNCVSLWLLPNIMALLVCQFVVCLASRSFNALIYKTLFTSTCNNDFKVQWSSSSRDHLELGL